MCLMQCLDLNTQLIPIRMHKLPYLFTLLVSSNAALQMLHCCSCLRESSQHFLVNSTSIAKVTEYERAFQTV